MLEKLKKINEYNILIIFSLIFLFKLFLNPHFGYDEHGAVITYIELDDPIFKDIYYGYFPQIIRNLHGFEVFANLFLSVFVVPLRWTYALGISPWLNFARFESIDWAFLRPFLLVPFLLLAMIGLYLIIKTLGKYNKKANIYIVGLLLFSTPFSYWILSFTSYSYHLFCFGLLLYAFKINSNDKNAKYISTSTIIKSMVVIFNYQYISIVFMMGVINFAENPKDFFIKLKFKNWALPFITCLLSSIFLFIRATITGKHSSPTYAALPEALAVNYNFLNYTDNFYSAFNFLFISFVNILKSFFDFKIHSYVIFATILFTIFYNIRNFYKINRCVIKFLIIFIAGVLILYLSGIMPLSPSRHQLILFLPFMLLFSMALQNFGDSTLPSKINFFAPYLFIFIAALYQITTIYNMPRGIKINFFKSALVTEKVQSIILAPCDFEPLLYSDIRSSFNPIYRCGPRIFKSLNPSFDRIAIWSSIANDDATLKSYLKDFSASKWFIYPYDGIYNSEEIGFLYVAIKSKEQ
jgi:hypothetical protein